MRTSLVYFQSDGTEVSALWRTPDTVREPLRAIVQGPGWMGTKDAGLYLQYHEELTARGFGVLIIDYRGFGENDPAGALTVSGQIRDLQNAVTYLHSLDSVRSDAIGVFGNGATGAGNAIKLAARDPRISAVVAQFPIANGSSWLRGMRNPNEWATFLKELEIDRVMRLRGAGRLVDPVREITLPSRERETTGAKADIASKVPKQVSLAIADELLAYCPIRAMPFVSAPTLLITVEGDLVTPEMHAVELYEVARCTRELIVHRNTTHYESYTSHGGVTSEAIANWFDRFIESESHLLN